MTDIEPVPAADDAEARTPVAPPPKSPLRRPGCVIALIIWFLILLTPCPLFILLTQGEIRINVGSAPDQHIRLWLVMEPRERGFGLSSPSIHPGPSEGEVCLQTDVRYLLWMGSAEDASYCECYQHPTDDSGWTPTTTITGMCPAP
jgi:hypothetical protein